MKAGCFNPQAVVEYPEAGKVLYSRGMVLRSGREVLTLEKRGYVKAGCFNPEAVVEYSEAGKVLQIREGGPHPGEERLCEGWVLHS